MNILLCMDLKFHKITKRDMTMFNSECIFNPIFSADGCTYPKELLK